MLKAGFARLDVTPPFGVPLAGYYEQRLADGILDPIQVNALAVQNGERTLVIVTADVLMISAVECDTLRAMINERTGIGAENVLIAALHPHTSVRIGGIPRVALQDREYVSYFKRKITDVAALAIADLADATVGVACGDIERPVSFVRRYILKDGRGVRTNPGHKTPEELSGPTAEADNTVRLVRFFREEGGDIALVNFATHPDTIGKTKMSADWPGFVRRFVEAEHAGAHCVFLNGFEGDSNHINYMQPKEGRFWKGYDGCEQIGRVIANGVNAIWDATAPMQGETLHAEQRDVYIPTSTRGLEYFEECKELSTRYRAGDRSVMMTPHGFGVPEANRIADIPTRPVLNRLPITVLGIGDIVIFALGGEPFTEYIYAARALLPEKFLLTACCANGGEGYFPTAKAYAEGGYEVQTSPFNPDLENLIMGTATEMLKKV